MRASVIATTNRNQLTQPAPVRQSRRRHIAAYMLGFVASVVVRGALWRKQRRVHRLLVAATITQTSHKQHTTIHNRSALRSPSAERRGERHAPCHSVVQRGLPLCTVDTRAQRAGRADLYGATSLGTVQ
jgi:hypothetical protein